MKHIHTTLPEKYYDYVKKNNLSWNRLLIKSIEQEMNQDPKLIQEKLKHNEVEHQRLLKNLETAKEKKNTAENRLQIMHKGLVLDE